MRSQSVVRSVVLALAVSLIPAACQAGVFVSITVAPPVLPVYVQPVIPAPGYLWTPGYWAYGPDGYFWVPGVWVRPPQVGLLWTPGYWGWHGGLYAWNGGYWGPHVGFYGGVNYGFGYGGIGFAGGRWNGGYFAYNSAVANVGVGGGFHSYHETVVENNVHTSFNGGAGGLRAQPSAAERSAMGEHHFSPTAQQNSHHEMASHDRSNLASVNHGRPANAAMSRPLSAASTNASHASGGSGGGNKAGGSASKPGGGNKSGGGAPKMAAASQHQSGGGGGQGKGSGGGGNKGGGGKPAAHASNGRK